MGPAGIDIAVIGGGLVGIATARALAEAGRRVLVLEAEERLAVHQSGRNSGVIHSGLYYLPGSLKARLCVEGAAEVYRLCGEEGIAHERCGKLVVATHPAELPRLDELERRGRANGIAGLARLGPEAIREIEPHAAGIAALQVPGSGIVDYPALARASARRVEERDGRIETGARLLRVHRHDGGLALETAKGDFRCRLLVNCAGLQSDRVARLCGTVPDVRILPFRGEYLELAPERRDLVKSLIYPVPDPRFPFLGVHLTRTVTGQVEAGPNAVLALKREGYRWRDVSPRDLWETASWPGSWRLLGQIWRPAAEEVWRSAVRPAFVAGLKRLVPELSGSDLMPGGSGVRAQAVDRRGRLVEDFHILAGERSIHVLNAPSPAATASPAIGRHVAELAAQAL